MLKDENHKICRGNVDKIDESTNLQHTLEMYETLIFQMNFIDFAKRGFNTTKFFIRAHVQQPPIFVRFRAHRWGEVLTCYNVDVNIRKDQ